MSMDALLKADDQRFVTGPIVFRQFLSSAKCSLETITNEISFPEEMKKLEGSTDFKTILESIDVTDLKNGMFNMEMDEGADVPQLKSQKIVMDENSRRRNAQYKSIALRALRYDRIDTKALARDSPFWLEDGARKERSKNKRINSAGYSDLIVTVSVYLGYTRELEYHEIRLGRLMKVTDRIELTGEHTLEDLKKSFSCPADFTFNEDFSEKTPKIEDIAKNKYPSNMFFIHDTFYIDSSLKEDPSATIRSWAENLGTFGPMQSLPMTTKLGDMTARLGQPYVFIHQGVCEHLIVFNELCLRDETHQGVEFPRRIIERNFRRIACDCCREESAKWVILEHEELMVNSPGHVCSSCFQELCFDVNGKKVSSFKAVPYCDRKEIGDGGKFLADLRFQKT